MRLKRPAVRGGDGGWSLTSWSDADKAVGAKLNEVSAAGKRIVVLSDTVISPSTKGAVAKLKERFPTVEHIQYDTISYCGVTNANLKSFGKRVMPSYDLTKADVIVSVE